jgi:hypothetical protein
MRYWANAFDVAISISASASRQGRLGVVAKHSEHGIEEARVRQRRDMSQLVCARHRLIDQLTRPRDFAALPTDVREVSNRGNSRVDAMKVLDGGCSSPDRKFWSLPRDECGRPAKRPKKEIQGRTCGARRQRPAIRLRPLILEGKCGRSSVPDSVHRSSSLS